MSMICSAIHLGLGWPGGWHLSGAPPNAKSRGLLTLLAVCGFLALAGASLDESGSERGVSAKAVDPVVQARPPDEAALLTYDGSWNKAYAEVGAAPNVIVRNQVESRWDKRFCAAMNKLKYFNNWTGRVGDINFNGYFEVELGEYINVYEIIEPSAKAFTVISGLRYNQPIKVSGYFLHGPEACSVFNDRRFKVYLTSIAPL